MPSQQAPKGSNGNVNAQRRRRMAADLDKFTAFDLLIFIVKGFPGIPKASGTEPYTKAVRSHFWNSHATCTPLLLSLGIKKRQANRHHDWVDTNQKEVAGCDLAMCGCDGFCTILADRTPGILRRYSA